MKDKYVFIDLAANEYVLAYPGNLGSETFEKDGPEPLRIARYELLRSVDPAVALAITAAGQKYKYAYTVTNGPKAKQSIDQWAMVLPVLARRDPIRQPEGWIAIIQNPRTFKLKNPEWIRGGVAAVWSFQKPENVVQPGQSKTGFELESQLNPGFTIAYLRKAESVESRVATHGNVPKAVKDQIDLLLAVEYNSQTVLTLGPKFDRNTDHHTVALDFIEGINVLGRMGRLDPKSEFVVNTLAELQTVKPGAARAALKLAAVAKTPLETEIMTALKLNFGSASIQ
jgi:hypothetical protein